MKRTRLQEGLQLFMVVSLCLIPLGMILWSATSDARLLFFAGGLLGLCALLRWQRLPLCRRERALPSERPVQALPAASASVLSAQDSFALLDERFEAVVQVRARHFQQGTIDLLEWEERYQALLQARQELETSTLREEVLRLDEYRAAVTSRRRQQRYERKLRALCDEAMETILQRADASMARTKASAREEIGQE
jgi:hypothetical protein